MIIQVPLYMSEYDIWLGGLVSDVAVVQGYQKQDIPRRILLLAFGAHVDLRAKIADTFGVKQDGLDGVRLAACW